MISHESSSRTRRPPLGARSASSSSVSKDPQRSLSGHPSHSLSPSTSSVLQKSHLQHRSHSKTHMVGHARTHTRVPSYGKNLHRLPKVSAAHPEEAGISAARAHRRSNSHTPPNSPQPQIHKRAGSNVSLVPNGANVSLLKNSSKVSLRKNRSDVPLKRNGSTNAVVKSTKREGNRKRADSHGASLTGRPRVTSVHFDLGDEDDHDDGWTEVSKSDSPTPKRERASPNAIRDDTTIQHSRSPSSGSQSHLPHSPPPSPPRTEHGDLTEGVAHHRQDPPILRKQNLSHEHLDPQAITSRLLHRTSQHNAPPQTSAISAIATPGSHSPANSLGRTQSLMVNGSGSRARSSRHRREDVVSRFVGSQERQTPAEGSPASKYSQPPDSKSNTPIKKPKSAVKFSTSPPSPSHTSALASQPRRSSSSANTSSRTQQKLWLQRAASSVTEPPQAHPNHPHPHSALPSHSSVTHFPFRSATSLDGPLTAQKHRDRATLEYRVVRRYQNPLGNSLARLGHEPGTEKKGSVGHMTTSLRGARGSPYVNGVSSVSGSEGKRMGLSQSMRDLPSKKSIAKAASGGMLVNGTVHHDAGTGADHTSIRRRRSDLSAIEAAGKETDLDAHGSLTNNYSPISRQLNGSGPSRRSYSATPNDYNGEFGLSEADRHGDTEVDGAGTENVDSVERLLRRLWEERTIDMMGEE
ncbi:MAG: hypothetical protein M1837_001593 [Sclerophora amabilis]|nr:MAG: hypothetical protein M1837_001593 [Sclerophora amabilis]